MSTTTHGTMYNNGTAYDIDTVPFVLTALNEQITHVITARQQLTRILLELDTMYDNAIEYRNAVFSKYGNDDTTVSYLAESLINERLTVLQQQQETVKQTILTYNENQSRLNEQLATARRDSTYHSGIVLTLLHCANSMLNDSEYFQHTINMQRYLIENMRYIHMHTRHDILDHVQRAYAQQRHDNNDW